jgi:hypothetical protein
MLSKPKRDVFRFSDGHEVDVNSLPAKLVFDVLQVPGKEELSAILKEDVERREMSDSVAKRESLLQRVAALL